MSKTNNYNLEERLTRDGMYDNLNLSSKIMNIHPVK